MTYVHGENLVFAFQCLLFLFLQVVEGVEVGSVELLYGEQAIVEV